MKYRLGTEGDLDAICKMVEEAKVLMEKQGILQWDHVYPNQQDFMDDIQNSNLYIALEDNNLAAIYVISQECDDEYHKCNWESPDEKACVIHRFCVSPDFQNKGIGRVVLNHIEQQLRDLSYTSVRLDVFLQNPYALSLYQKNGYVERGYADWRKGRFLLMEKKL